MNVLMAIEAVGFVGFLAVFFYDHRPDPNRERRAHEFLLIFCLAFCWWLTVPVVFYLVFTERK